MKNDLFKILNILDIVIKDISSLKKYLENIYFYKKYLLKLFVLYEYLLTIKRDKLNLLYSTIQTIKEIIKIIKLHNIEDFVLEKLRSLNKKTSISIYSPIKRDLEFNNYDDFMRKIDEYLIKISSSSK